MTNQKLDLVDIDQLFGNASIIVFKRNIGENFPFIFVTDNVGDTLGLEANSLIQNQDDWFSRISTSDQKEIINSYQKLIKGCGSVKFEYQFRKPTGSYITLCEEIHLQLDKNGNPVTILGTIIELSDTKSSKFKKVETELINRLEYQNALSECSNLLIDSSDSNTVEKAMKVLLDTTRTDRVYIFTSDEKDGNIFLSQIHEVCAEGVPSEIDNREMQDMPFESLPWVFGQLSQNKVVNVPIKNLPSPEREFMSEQEIKSFLLLPIFIEDDWFGFLGFDSTRQEKLWDEYEVALLKTASEIIGTYFKRKSVEESLLEQKDFTQQMLNSLPSITVLLNKEMKLKQWNKTTERLTGYNSSELKELSAYDIVAPEEHEEMEEALGRVMNNRSEGAEINLINKYGKKTPYFWRASMVQLRGEHMFIIVGLNVTDQKEMENALLESKRLGDAIINSLPGIFYMIDRQGRYLNVNKNFLEEFGYTKSDLISITALNMYDDDEKHILVEKIEEVFTKGWSDVELHPKTKSGKKLPYYLKAVRFDRGDESYILGTGHSIIEQKQREEELEASVKEKQVLLQEIHHRVKNNLAVISGLLELQVSEHEDPEFKRLVLESQRRIQTMAIIHEKLYQSEKLSQISMLLYINELIEQIESSFNIGSKKIKIETSIEDIEMSINQAIPFALALNEIISNSMEHAFKGRESGNLSVNLNEENGVVHTVIKDNGIGFTEEKTERTSLGMTLINALLTQVGADWEVKSDNGVTYDIEFPLGRIDILTAESNQ